MPSSRKELLDHAREVALEAHRGQNVSATLFARIAREARRVVLAQAFLGMWRDLGAFSEGDLEELYVSVGPDNGCLIVGDSLTGGIEFFFDFSRTLLREVA